MAEQHLESKIKEIDQTHKPVVVLLKVPGADGAMMETIVRTSGLATLREQTTLFVLSTTPAEAAYLQPVRDALNKASLPPLSNSDLPVVLVIGKDGKALKVVRGLVTAGEVRQCLSDGVAAFASQVKSETSTTASESSKQDASSLAEGKQVGASPGPPQDPTPPQTPNLGPAGTASVLEHGTKGEPAVASSSSSPETTPGLDPSAPLQLQVYLPDGQAIRATFTGATLLKEVCSHLEQHSPDGISPRYKLVSHHLRREFTEEDMSRSLHDLGVASMTSLRLQAMDGGNYSAFGSFTGLSNFLSAVRQLIIRILAQLGFGHKMRDRASQDNADAPNASQAAGSGQDSIRPDRPAKQQDPASHLLRKRNRQPATIHSIHDTDDSDSNKKPDGNSYWNGNSTQFDADE